MNTILEFLKQPLWLDAATGWWLLLAAVAIADLVISRVKSVRANSIVAALTHIVRLLLVRVGLMRLPVVGPLVVGLLEAISGVDIDGDGKVGDKPAAPPAAAAVLLLGLGLLPALSCAHVTPVVETFVDCAAPEVQEVKVEVRERVIDVLVCGAMTASAPPCVAAGLADLYNDHGRPIVDCLIVAIRDSFSAPAGATPDQLERAALARRRAAEVIKSEEARGVRFVSRPPQ